MTITKYISVKGAKEHNLKSVDVNIPKNKLTVFTGVSGSGKSSLAFNTIYAEGQRKYMESLSAYARQFISSFNKPQVESIEGLSPAISIEQKTTSHNPRSTVGTTTEIYDYLRLLYAKIGVPHSPATGKPITKQTIDQIVDQILKNKEGSKLLIIAPVIRNKKINYMQSIQHFARQGFSRFRINGDVLTTEEIQEPVKNKKYNVDVVIDRIVIKGDLQRRVSESTELALKVGNGSIVIYNNETQEETLLSEKYACPISGFSIDNIEPSLFSFNAPLGSCKECSGIGYKHIFTENSVLIDSKNPVANAFHGWGMFGSSYYKSLLASTLEHLKIHPDTPYYKLSEEDQNAILYGTKDSISFNFNSGKINHTFERPFEGILNNFHRRWQTTESESSRTDLAKYQEVSVCEECSGKRLNQQALSVKVNALDISELCGKSVSNCIEWFNELNVNLTENQQKISARIIKEINSRLKFLSDVGLNYLTLMRGSSTLSGGEAQRIRLASQIGSGLTGVLYVLDEPSIGLHQKDNQRLINTLQYLRDLDNTVIVVEHDDDTIRASDYVVDVGPMAGEHGGNIVFSGEYKDLLKQESSLTADYLSGRKTIFKPDNIREKSHKFITINSACGNNLKNVSVSIPISRMTCVTGVSGSGKSTLINKTLIPGALNRLGREKTTALTHKSIDGLEYIDNVINIDQSSIGRTSRSNPITYVGAFDYIRDLFAGTNSAKERGYKKGRFSFNVKGGRCENCEGNGTIKVEMHFLPDVYVICDACNGKRYNRETLEITWNDKHICDIMDMYVDDAVDFFANIPQIYRKIKSLQDVGLGYIRLGQSATTLSGGEAQRIKLAKELSKKNTSRTLYVLDEPTTGLHFEDVNKLLKILHTLVDNGNTMVIIEHNLDVIVSSDYIIDIGPNGGKDGGTVVAKGTPSEIAMHKSSYTGHFIKEKLQQNK